MVALGLEENHPIQVWKTHGGKWQVVKSHYSCCDNRARVAQVACKDQTCTAGAWISAGFMRLMSSNQMSWPTRVLRTQPAMSKQERQSPCILVLVCEALKLKPSCIQLIDVASVPRRNKMAHAFLDSWQKIV